MEDGPKEELALSDIFVRVPGAVEKKGRGFFLAPPCGFISMSSGSPLYIY